MQPQRKTKPRYDAQPQSCSADPCADPDRHELGQLIGTGDGARILPGPHSGTGAELLP